MILILSTRRYWSCQQEGIDPVDKKILIMSTKRYWSCQQKDIDPVNKKILILSTRRYWSCVQCNWTVIYIQVVIITKFYIISQSENLCQNSYIERLDTIHTHIYIYINYNWLCNVDSKMYHEKSFQFALNLNLRHKHRCYDNGCSPCWTLAITRIKYFISKT